jgi:hypothetical protein
MGATDPVQIKTTKKCEGSPPQGLSEARRGKEVFFDLMLVTDPPRGALRGGGVHRNFHDQYNLARFNKIFAILSRDLSKNYLKIFPPISFQKSFLDFFPKFSRNIFKKFPDPENIPVHSPHYPPHSAH